MAILEFVFDEDKNTPRQEKLEIAKEMLSEQEPIKKVVRFTGLDLVLRS